MNTDKIVAFIGGIFARRGAEAYLGEDVTMSQHMLQCARLAEMAEAGDQLIAAALLHDIGHFTNEFPDDALAKGIDNQHDAAGAHILQAAFPTSVVNCVRHHVAAKRYLCATDPSYFGRLSSASVHTLKLQGGPMDRAETAAFSQLPNLSSILQVRFWDESAKDPDIKTPDFDHYAPLLQNIVEANDR